MKACSSMNYHANPQCFRCTCDLAGILVPRRLAHPGTASESKLQHQPGQIFARARSTLGHPLLSAGSSSLPRSVWPQPVEGPIGANFSRRRLAACKNLVLVVPW
jgi:hypothetical protein